MQLDRKAHVPLYSQIAEQFQRRISSRLWPAGYRLPSEDELAVSLGVARGTLRRAIRELSDKGLLVQVHGRGTFVMDAGSQPGELGSHRTATISSGERLAKEGVFFTTEVLTRKLINDTERVGPFPGGAVLHLERIRRLTEGPDAYLLTNLALDAVPRIEQATDEQLAAGPLRTLLRNSFGVSVDHLDRMYTAVLADEHTSALLDVPVGAPLLSFEEFVFDEAGNCFEYSCAIVRTDRHPVAVDR